MTRQSSLLDRARSPAMIASVLIILAMVLGGGGSPAPFMELLLNLLAAALALGWLWTWGTSRSPDRQSLWLLSALIVIIPIVQLIPLPAAIWGLLPGREWQVAALELVGSESSWRPISTSPSLTLASLIVLGPPLLLLWMTSALPSRERRWLLATIGCLALASALLGMLQLAGGQAAPRLYSSHLPRIVTGFQANRNATADVLLIGLVALAAIAAQITARQGHSSRSGSQPLIWLGSAALVLILACIFTASRAGIALILPTLFACWVILSLDKGKWSWSWPRLTAISAFVVLLSGGLFLLLRQNAGLQMIAGRFDFDSDGREHLWTDTLSAISQYWPLGSGVGTFVPTFIALEPLSSVDNSTPNRAHNDYLELALEAGPIGILVLAAGVITLILLARRAWRERVEDRSQIIFGVAALAIIAAHSIVDYPLRSMSLACLAAVAAGMFIAPPAPRAAIGGDKTIPAGKARALPVMLTGLIVGYAAVSYAVGVDRISRSNPTLERLVPPPLRYQADRSAAAIALASGQPALALQYASKAVRSDPGSAEALALLGSARLAAGDTTGADATFRVAAQRGWRNPMTQLYWFEMAMNAGDIRLAALRADALLRTAPSLAVSGEILAPLEATEDGRAAIAQRLAERPVWLSAYFRTHWQMEPSTLLTKSDVATRLANLGVRDCELLYGLTARMLSKGMQREAVSLWRSSCNARFEKGLSDGNFTDLANEDRRSPFGWQRHLSGDVEVSLTDGGANGGSMVLAQNSSPATKLILSQAIDVEPGTYLVTARVLKDGAPAAGTVSVSLDCDGIRRRPRSPDGDIAESGQRLTIGDCPRPLFGIWLRPGTEVSLDDVRITPAQR